MASRVTIYFEDACRFYEEALREFEEGVRENNAYKIRDPLKTHGMLRELEAKLPEIGRLMLRDRYGARERHLHEMVFYEGNVDIEDVKYELEKVKAYLNDVGEVLRSTKECPP